MNDAPSRSRKHEPDQWQLVASWVGLATQGPPLWRHELELARTLDLSCLAAKSLADRMGPKHPEELKDAIASFLQWRQTNLVRMAFSAKLMGSLERVGIACIPFKGVALVNREYRDPGLRPMDDTDLLVRNRDYELALRELRQRGYKQLSPVRGAGSGSYQQLFKGPQRFVFEVHRAFEAPELFPIDYDGIIDRALQSRPTGDGLHLMEPNDTLLGLAVHFVKHGFMLRARDVVDFALVCARVADWSDVWRRAEDWRLGLALHCALALSRRLRDCSAADAQRPRSWRYALGTLLLGSSPPFSKLSGWPEAAHVVTRLTTAGPAPFARFMASYFLDRGAGRLFRRA